MKHCILVKFIPNYNYLKELDNIKSIFNSININGINNIEYKLNCINKDNRYDLLIRIDMSKEALDSYDISSQHQMWKDKYSTYIEKKAIFDYE